MYTGQWYNIFFWLVALSSIVTVFKYSFGKFSLSLFMSILFSNVNINGIFLPQYFKVIIVGVLESY